MATALFAPFLADDAIVYNDCSGTALTVTKGDWVAASGQYVIAAFASGVVGSPAASVAGWKTSGIGIALANNPFYDELGVQRVQTALPILRHGIVRVSGMTASALGTDAPVMQPVVPGSTSSGIVGQTGATGMGPIWFTAALVNASGATAANRPSGVARLLKVITFGSTGQWDVLLTPEDNGYF